MFEDLHEERGSAASDAYIGSGTATAPPPKLLKLSELPHTIQEPGCIKHWNLNQVCFPYCKIKMLTTFQKRAG